MYIGDKNKEKKEKRTEKTTETPDYSRTPLIENLYSLPRLMRKRNSSIPRRAHYQTRL